MVAARKIAGTPRIGDGVYDEKYINTKTNPNGYVIRVFYEDREVLVKFSTDKWHEEIAYETYSFDELCYWNDTLSVYFIYVF